MVRLKLNSKQRDLYADKVLDLSHLVLGGMVVGQFLSDNKYSVSIGLSGIVIVVFLYWLSYTFTKRNLN